MSTPRDYNQAWRNGSIQRHIRTKAGHRCEHCHMPFKVGTNKALFHTNADGKPTIGTVHHIDGNKDNYAYTNLVYLCQRCHLHVQGNWTTGQQIPGAWLQDGKPPRWITRRHLPYSIQLSFNH